MINRFILAIVLAYFIGAIPFGMIAAKLKGGIDITQYGSGKIGATNVLRTSGKKSATIVLVCDIVKGTGAVLLARWLMGVAVITPNLQLLPGAGYVSSGALFSIGVLKWNIYGVQAIVAMAAVAGHNWSPYIAFRGGRGVAAFFGGLIPMNWLVSIVCGLGILIGVASLTRYVSLGSVLSVTIASTVMLILYISGYQPLESLVYAVAGATLIIVQHRDNIMRLRAGTERKIGSKPEHNTNG